MYRPAAIALAASAWLGAVQHATAQSLPTPSFSTPPVGDTSSRAATTSWVRQQNFIGMTGDASGTTVLVPGSTVPRSAAARAAAEFNVLDYGAVADGQTDLAPALNAIAAHLGAPGAANTILIPPGVYRLASPVVFSGNAPIIKGQGFSQGPGGVGSGTWIKIDQTGFTPFTFTGTNARGAAVRDVAIFQVHPAPGQGWSPSPYDYVFRVQNALGEVKFDNVLFAGVNRGIYADNSGRLNVVDVQGQFFTAGIELDDCFDIPRIQRLHAWTFATSDPSVVSWQEANSDTVILRRVDGIFVGDLFSLGARSVLHMTTGSNGVTTKAYIKSLYADFVDQAVWIDGPGSDAQIDSMTSQGNDQTSSANLLPSSRAVWINAIGVTLQIGNLYSKLTQGSAVQVDGSGNRVNIANLRANTFGTVPGDGTPAITVSDTGANPANGVYVGNKEHLQGAAPLVLFNAGGNGGRQRFAMMNDAGGPNVNEPRAYSSAAGGPASLAAIGADTSIDLQLQAKSPSGSVRLQAGGQTVLRADAAGGSSNDVLVRGGAGSMNVIAEGADPNVDVYVTAKGANGGTRLQANGLVTLRSDNPNAGDSDLLVRPGTGAINLVAESGSSNADIIASAKGPSGGIRVQSNGLVTLRSDNPNAGDSDLLVRPGTGAINLVAESGSASADIIASAKGPSGGIRLQTNGLVTLRSDNPNSGDSDLLVRPGTGVVNLVAESASAAADMVASGKGVTGGIRLQANGLVTFRTDNPNSGDSDLLVRGGTGVVALTAESASPNAGLALNPKGAGTVTAPTPAATDNSTSVATTAFVRSQGFAPLASPVFSGNLAVTGSANSVALSGAASGNPSSVTAAGSDANVDLQLAAQAAGSVRLRANGVTVLRADSPGPGTTDVLVRSGGGTVSFTAEDAGSNANLSFVPKGSGSILMGGNVSGSGAVTYTSGGVTTLTGGGASITALGSAGTTGSTVTLKGGEAHSSVQTASSGNTLTVAANTARVLLLSGVTTGGFTLAMMSAPVDGQVVLLECDVSVTLTVVPGSGQTMKGVPTACSATQGHQFHFRSADAAWRMDF